MSTSKNIAVIEDKNLSDRYNKRYGVIDKDTGDVLDDAQGYGYKSVQNAYKAYGYKNRDKSKDAEKLARKNYIKKWLKELKEFEDAMELAVLDSIDGDRKPVNASVIKRMLKERNLEPDFTAGELLKAWNWRVRL